MSDTCDHPTDGLLAYEEALGFLLERAAAVDAYEDVATEDALGRVLARPVGSGIDVPAWDNSAMDGYAVRAADVPAAGAARLPITQRIAAGQVGAALAAGSAARIFTGAPMPAGADTVVMQERCRVEDGGIVLEGPLRPGGHVRARGNDIAAGSEVLSAGTRLRPQEMGLAASVGVARLSVYRRLRVALFATGDELVMPGRPLGAGQLYNSNRYTLLGLLRGLGCEVRERGIVPDDFQATREALLEGAREADLILTSGGVSVGEEDHVKSALEEVGRLEMWRIRIKPGKPLAYGRVGAADFIGVPGNPVSALVTCLLFVRPFVLRRQGVAGGTDPGYAVRAAFDWPRPGVRREFARARLVRAAGGELEAEVFPRQGSDVLTSAVWADGLVVIPEQTTVRRGERVTYLPFAGLLG